MNSPPNKTHTHLRVVEGANQQGTALEKNGSFQPENKSKRGVKMLLKENDTAPSLSNVENPFIVPAQLEKELGSSPNSMSMELAGSGLDIEDFTQWLSSKYRNLLEQLPAITYLASLEKPGELLYLNPKIQDLGFVAEKWLENPESYFDGIHEDDRARVKAAYAAACAQQIPLSCEYRRTRVDGKVRWFRDEANIVESKSGEMACLQGVLTDITSTKESESELLYYRTRLDYLVSERTSQLERKCSVLKSANFNLVNALNEQRRIELALRNSEEHLRMMLESAGEGILGLDVNGRCTFANKTALTMLGYKLEDVLDQDLYALIRMGSELDASISSGQWDVYDANRNDMPLRNAETFKRKDGKPLRVEYSSYPMHLNDKLHGAVLIFRDVTESLCYQATHDPLTGLINRTEFWRRMNRALANAHEHHSEHVLCYLDLDQFKIINDTCGHAAGDQLLCKLSALLQSKLRQRDSLARMGGDEFALLLEHCTIEQGYSLADELCESINNYCFIWENQSFPIGVSIGLTTLTRADSDIGTVLRKADAACYMAKEQGRSRVQTFKSPPFKQYHLQS